MSFLKSMQERYTTKMYDATKKIDKQKIEELKEILRLSPSSINSQPWEFIFVSDKETKRQLAEVSKHNKEKILNCDTVVVFNGIDNISLFEEQIQQRLPEGSINYYNNFIKPLSEHGIKAWIHKQVYLALGVFMSACAEMQIDSTPMEGIQPKEYDKILNQTDYKTVVAIAIGYRDKEDYNQLSKNPKSRRKAEEVIKSI
ncbi:nitroreductase family protein [Weeksellaceae bacterium TAE3-ERU29]|nr:nitroreductase family protein [Weeksellaceae bacterium TAE3-ERU29]